MKQYVNTFLVIGVTLVLVIVVSWAAFPGWQAEPGGFFVLVATAIVGTVSLIKGILEVRDLLEKSKSKSDQTSATESTSSATASNHTLININIGEESKGSRVIGPVHPQGELTKILHNVPHPNYTSFVGREKEIKIITSLLRPYPNSQHHIITIHGIGGIGKSALALKIAHSYIDSPESYAEEERFAAIIWVTAKHEILTADGIKPVYHHFEMLKDIYREIASVLDWDSINRTLPEAQNEVVLKALTNQRTLLIIDNLETIDDENVLAFIRDLPAPTKAIITTRHWVDVAYPIKVSAMPWRESKKIINQLCKDNQVTLSDDEKKILFERTGGVPLAIVWSISLMGTMQTFQSVQQQLGQPNNDIARFCFEQSWTFIENKPAMKILMIIALFDSGVTREMVGEVIHYSILDRDDSLSILYRLALVNKSSDTFTLLPMTKEFVLSKIASDPSLKCELRKYFVQYFVDYCKMHGGEKVLSYHLLDDQLKNIQNALKWASQERLPKAVGEIADSIMEYLDRRGMWTEMVEYAKMAVLAAQESQDRMLEARHKIYGLGWIKAIRFRKYPEGLKSIQEGKAIAEACDDLREYAIALRNEGLVYRYILDYDKSMELLTKSMELSQQLGEHRWVIRAIGSMGTTEQSRGNLDSAVQYYRKALQMAEDNGDLEQIALNRRRIAKAYISKKDLDQAITCANEAIKIYQELNNTPDIGDTFIILGQAMYLQNKFNEAKTYAEKGYGIAIRLGYPDSVREAEELLGMIDGAGSK